MLMGWLRVCHFAKSPGSTELVKIELMPNSLGVGFVSFVLVPKGVTEVRLLKPEIQHLFLPNRNPSPKS